MDFKYSIVHLVIYSLVLIAAKPVMKFENPVSNRSYDLRFLDILSEKLEEIKKDIKLMPNMTSHQPCSAKVELRDCVTSSGNFSFLYEKIIAGNGALNKTSKVALTCYTSRLIILNMTLNIVRTFLPSNIHDNIHSVIQGLNTIILNVRIKINFTSNDPSFNLLLHVDTHSNISFPKLPKFIELILSQL